ncbi:MAG: hypothetical protein JSS36_09350 [Proteobacteria bacterium]|nr:hypothetical protein [Pseudomonadota bacterium]
MSKLSYVQIGKEAKARLASAPDGLRWGNLVKDIAADHPETPENSIWGATQRLFKEDASIIKVSKGIYALLSAVEAGERETAVDEPPEISSVSVAGKTLKESDFYKPFAEWLMSLDEVTEAIPVGGNILKGKWNTPDVIGVLRPLSGDLVKFSPKIVSAEIKIDPAQPVTAFGQAVSYRLFSHKSYLVLPNTTIAEDLDRIEALCGVFGLGLVVFDLNEDRPDFRMVTRAISAEPDMIYVNQLAKRLNQVDSKAFDRLF